MLIMEVISESNSSSVEGHSFDFTLNRTDANTGYKLVKLADVQAFDDRWRTYSPSFYIGKGGEPNGIRGRYERFGNFILGGTEQLGSREFVHEPAQSIEASTVHINNKGGIDFDNGRHRYAWLRDHNASDIYVAMTPESIQNARKFGFI